MKAGRGLCFALALAGCAGPWAKLSPTEQPAASAFPQASAVTLLDDRTVHYFAAPSAPAPGVDVTRHVRARILREDGESITKIVVPYRLAFSSIVAFRARTIAPDGTIRHYDRKDAADVESHAEFMLYSDSRALVLDASPKVPGTVIEYEYTVRHVESRLGDFGLGFGGVHPALHVRLAVDAPRGWRIDHLTTQLDQPISFPPVKDTIGDRTRWIWERHDLPALPTERWAPPARQLTTQVHVRLASWDAQGKTVVAPRDAAAFSAWMHQLTALPPSTAAIERLATELVKDPKAPPLERARTLYNWVRDNVSYCAIAIGLGGWRPHPADDVLRLRYGDCKDKANLLVRLLAAQGIRASLAMVNAHEGMAPRFALPTASFNHAIVAIERPDAELLFADPTSRTTPFGSLPVQDQESEVLPIEATGHALLVTPASRAENNTEDGDFVLHLDGSKLVGTFEVTRVGALADGLRHELATAATDKRTAATTRHLGLVAKIERVTFKDDRVPDVAKPLTITGTATLPTSSTAGIAFLFRLSDLIDEIAPALPEGPRRHPLVLRMRKRLHHRVHLALPEGSELLTLPAPVTIDRPFGHYDLTWKRDGQELVLDRTFVLRERIFLPADYATVKAFFDLVLAAESRAITVRKPKE